MLAGTDQQCASESHPSVYVGSILPVFSLYVHKYNSSILKLEVFGAVQPPFKSTLTLSLTGNSNLWHLPYQKIRLAFLQQWLLALGGGVQCWGRLFLLPEDSTQKHTELLQESQKKRCQVQNQGRKGSHFQRRSKAQDIACAKSPLKESHLLRESPSSLSFFLSSLLAPTTRQVLSPFLQKQGSSSELSSHSQLGDAFFS